MAQTLTQNETHTIAYNIAYNMTHIKWLLRKFTQEEHKQTHEKTLT